MFTRRVSLLLSSLLLLTACGTSPPTRTKSVRQPSPGPAAPAQPGPPQPGQPQPGVPGADPIADARRCLAGAGALVSGYQLQMKWWTKKGASSTTGVYGIQGIQRATRVDVEQGEGEGTILLWQGSGKVRVKMPGLLGAVPVSLEVGDSRITSIRGYTLAQTNLPALLEIANDPAHTAVPVAPGQPGMRLTGGKLLDGTMAVDIYPNLQAGLPAKIEFRDAREVVYRMEFRNFKKLASGSLEL